jgi:hypothetical protein
LVLFIEKKNNINTVLSFSDAELVVLSLFGGIKLLKLSMLLKNLANGFCC